MKIELSKLIDINDIEEVDDLYDIDIELSDIFSKISDSDLIDEFVERELDAELDLPEKELSEFSFSDIAAYLSDLPPYALHDIMCDIVGVNHHTDKTELLKLISEKI